VYFLVQPINFIAVGSKLHFMGSQAHFREPLVDKKNRHKQQPFSSHYKDITLPQPFPFNITNAIYSRKFLQVSQKLRCIVRPL
jgi:hypothetical protein